MTFRSLTLDDIDPNWQASGRWRRGQALGTPGGMAVPVFRIFVHHTVSADTGDVAADVAGPCDTDQANFGKVSYSWNIHESTNSVIEVEGTCRGAHTINNKRESLNGVSFGFGVIGNFHPSQAVPAPREPSQRLLELIAEAIVEKAVKPGYTAPGFTIEGHRDAPYATACCGDSLYVKLPIIRALVTSPHAPPVNLKELPMEFFALPDTGPHFYVNLSNGMVIAFHDGPSKQNLIAASNPPIPEVHLSDATWNEVFQACVKIRTHAA